MTVRERFQNTLNFKPCDDRLPMIEWVGWWEPTIERWHSEGLDNTLDTYGIYDELGLDRHVTLGVTPVDWDAPFASKVNSGEAIVTDVESYNKIKDYLYTEKNIERAVESAECRKQAHDKGEIAVKIWMDGCFWFPRALLGIENHFYAFYDKPDLIHMMNDDLTRFNIRMFEAITEVLTPEFVGIAEDMSYNHGPMLSHELFSEFILPYYRRLVSAIKNKDTKIMVDSDGDVTQMIPWMNEAGIDGIYPHERQAGCDIVKIREQYPDLLLLGGFDKIVMNKGEEAIRAEFERILPVMKSGGFIPSVDHQTPPDVSLDDYKLYVCLFKEYCRRAVD